MGIASWEGAGVRTLLRCRRAAVGLAALALLGGCHRATTQATSDYIGPAGGLLITAERIERSGAHTAWEALKRTAPHLNLRDNRQGQPARITRRGENSIYLNSAPVLVLDGVVTPDFRVLDQIPAHTISSIYIMTGIEGTTYYGTNAVGGVILIRTKSGPES